MQLSKKYRPGKFSDLIGQESNAIILKKIVRDKIFNIPFLFTGPWGSGKTSASRVFARAILCKNLTPDTEPCGVCQSCIDLPEDKNVDYVEIDAASNGDVESIRNLREDVNYASINSDFKITNIDEAHNITKSGYNALLKQLEEGASHHIFIFCTNEPEKMLHTVRSRCWRIHSQAISPDMIYSNLKIIAEKESIQVEEDAMKLIGEVTAPHIRDAQNTLDFLKFKGNISKADVENYFQLTNENLFLELFINLKADLVKAAECLDKLVDSFDVEVIFEKVIEIALTCESHKKGVTVKHGYLDKALFEQASQLGCDYLAIASFLLKIERPLDINYLRCLFLELNRLLNNEVVTVYGDVKPNVVHAVQEAVEGSPTVATVEPASVTLPVPEDSNDSWRVEGIRVSRVPTMDAMYENSTREKTQKVKQQAEDALKNPHTKKFLTSDELKKRLQS